MVVHSAEPLSSQSITLKVTLAIQQDSALRQAWCCAGNALSLARDHDGALRCFRRALALDPSFAYGHTLCGHEHLANDDYDAAQAGLTAPFPFSLFPFPLPLADPPRVALCS